MHARPASSLLTALITLVSIAACSSAPAPVEIMNFKAPTPLVSAMSASGSLSLDVRTSPQPPIEGIQSAQLIITETATGKPVDGLRIAVVPWMPAMGHGTSLVPTVAAKGAGTYQVDQLSLFMGGEWELRLTLDGASLLASETANPVFDVP